MIATTVLVAGAIIAWALGGRGRVAVRHVVLVATLAASVVATVASLSRASVTIEVPWLRQSQVAPAPGGSPLAIGPATRPFARPSMSANVERAMTWLWLVGIACVTLRALRQTGAARAFRRRAAPVTDPAWTRAIAIARVTTGFDQPFDVLVSAEIDIPFVSGLRRPAVLIPSSGCEWSDEEKRSVLAHEIAHLMRFDLWTRTVATLACALHWFNPLVWWLASRAEHDAELAADDLALRSGILPSTYAGALLSLAERTAWRRPAPIVLAFARRSSIEPRILAVLEPTGSAWLVGSRTRVAVIAGSCAIAATVGCVRLAPRTAADTRTALAVSTSAAVTAQRQPVAPSALRDTTAKPKPSTTRRPRAVTEQRETAAPATGDWMDDAVQGLIATLDDPSPQVRSAAARSLLRLGDGESRAIVDRALSTSNVSRTTLERIRTEKQ